MVKRRASEEPLAREPSPSPSSSSAIPPLSKHFTAWTVKDIPEHPPPLPPITHPALEKAAFIHEGARQTQHETSYERLEFLGDAFIYHLASELIAQTFPRHSPGQCTHMRERLLCNAAMFKYAKLYDLDQRANLPAEFHGSGREGGTRATEKQRNKAYADIFEAYIGALIHSGPEGETRAIQWLKPLWSMTIAKEIQGEYRQRETVEKMVVNQSLSAQDKLVQLIGCLGVKIRYEELPSKKQKLDKNNHLPLFHFGVVVNGWGKTEQLAVASAHSKSEAREKAAKLALDAKKPLKFWEAKKQQFKDAQKSSEPPRVPTSEAKGNAKQSTHGRHIKGDGGGDDKDEGGDGGED